MPSAICPECHEEVYVDAESEQGTVVTCDECGAKLVVVGLDPIELDLQEGDDDPSVSEDFDDYEYDDSRY
jgi:alpha-aminoadipate carrier protein LysW